MRRGWFLKEYNHSTKVRPLKIIFLFACSVGFSAPIYGQTMKSSDSAKLAVDTLNRMDGVLVKSQRGSYIDAKGMGLKEVLTQSEFKKAACCTLSESFEVTNTVEVSNADGISGMKQIELLGLASKYVQLSRDNMVLGNGIGNVNALANIPGPMIGNVQISKGIGSVTNGYSGTTGGINFSLKANPDDPKVFFNLYANNQSRNEANLIYAVKRKNWLNHTYFHRGSQFITTDMGHDGFADMPIYNRYVFGNHTQIYGKKTEQQFGIFAWNDTRKSGEVKHGEWGKLLEGPNRFRFNLDEQHVEGYLKFGIFLPHSKFAEKFNHNHPEIAPEFKLGKLTQKAKEEAESTGSLGNILQISKHSIASDLNSLISRQYQANEWMIHYNFFHQSEEINHHNFKSGLEFQSSFLQEKLNDSLGFHFNNHVNTQQIGLFHEWKYENSKFVSVTGIRLDYHNIYHLYFTPRIHLKYNFNPNLRINLQSGIGRRRPYYFSDNLSQFMNNRKIMMQDAPIALNKHLMYPMERAWNTGLSVLQNFTLFEYPATITTDVFYTQFLNQTLVDRDLDLQYVYIKYLSDKKAGRTLSTQVDFSGYLHRRLSYKLSYRYNQSMSYLGNQFVIQPFQSLHRWLSTWQFQTRNQWYFDLIYQLNGKKRIPYFSLVNPTIAGFPNQLAYSKPYSVINFQIRKNLKSWEIYSGVENILNVHQHQAILNQNGVFDAAYSWGPTNGRTVYFGFRLSI